MGPSRPRRFPAMRSINLLRILLIVSLSSLGRSIWVVHGICALIIRVMTRWYLDVDQIGVQAVHRLLHLLSKLAYIPV